MNKISFTITNLNCDACVKLSLGAMKKIPGVCGAQVDFRSGRAELFAEKEIQWSEILCTLKAVDKHIQK